MRPKDTQFNHTVSNTFLLIMTKQVMISMLAQGNTAAEILSILDAITSENVSEVYNNEPTGDVIEF